MKNKTDEAREAAREAARESDWAKVNVLLIRFDSVSEYQEGFNVGLDSGFDAGIAYQQVREEHLERMLANLIDSRYGTDIHHIGDSDGIPDKEAAEIAEFWVTYLEKKYPANRK